MPAVWLQNYFNTIQTPNTFENRNVIRYNLNIFTAGIFSLKSAQQKMRIFSLGRKINILVKKKKQKTKVCANLFSASGVKTE